MNEKIIKAVVPLVPLILIITCTGAAFATHGWDVQATLVEENPVKVLERLLPAEADIEEEPFEVTGVKLSENGTKLVLEGVLHSPLNVPVTIKEMVAKFTLEGNTATIRLPEEIEVPARGSANLRLEGALPELQNPLTFTSREKFALESLDMTLDICGIELKLEESVLGGAGG